MIYQEQEGKCVYTGWKLSSAHDPVGRDMKRLTLDRIDSTKGYIKGNVQFVSLAANTAKNCFTHEEMVEFCRAIARKWQ